MNDLSIKFEKVLGFCIDIELKPIEEAWCIDIIYICSVHKMK